MVLKYEIVPEPRKPVQPFIIDDADTGDENYDYKKMKNSIL